MRHRQSDANSQRLPTEQRNRILGRLRLQIAPQTAPVEMREIVALADEVRAARQGRRAEAPREKPSAAEVLPAAAVPAVEDAMRQAQRYLRPRASLTVGCWKHTPARTGPSRGT